MAESEGMGALAGYMLGRASVQQDQFIENWSSRLRRRSGPTFEQLTHELLDQRDSLRASIAELNESVRQANLREGALESKLSEVEGDLERQRALTKEWVTYADVGDRNMERLQKWADDAEASLKQYRALYGPLPEATKSGS